MCIHWSTVDDYKTYGSRPKIPDYLGTAMPSSIEYIRAGKLRALAVTTAMRSDAFPEIPTIGEFVPGYEASFWFGVGAPKATSGGMMMGGGAVPNLKSLDPGDRVQAIDHCGDTYK